MDKGRWFRRSKSFDTAQAKVEKALADPTSNSTQYISTAMYEGLSASYADIYKTQPNVRTVIDFLARNLAQLTIKAYERVGNTERKELHDHPAAELLRHPNPYTTRYRMAYGLVADLAVYDIGFWMKVRTPTGKFSLVRVPPKYVSVKGGNLFRPTGFLLQPYRILGNSEELTIAPEDMIYFHGYNPDDPRIGFPPLETLRRILAEDLAAGRHREGYFNNAGRQEGVIERPSTAPQWSEAARKHFDDEWTNNRAGAANAGKPLVLEDDMHWNSDSFSPKDSEYITGRELSMKTVARAFHIPLAMVGLMDQSNWGVEQYHGMLYTETLPPWTVWIEEELELQLLPEFPNSENVYLEHNLAEKLKGSFETQATILTLSAGGAAWLTRNEARARQNLPRIDDPEFDIPIPPVRGGGAAPAANEAPPADVVPEVPQAPPAKAAVKAAPLGESLVDPHVEAHTKALKAYFEHQGAAVVSKTGAKVKAFDSERWNKALQALLLEVGTPAADDAGTQAARRFRGEFDVTRAEAYLAENARIAAENINFVTEEAVAAADGTDAVNALFVVYAASRASEIAQSRVTQLVSFGTHEAAAQSGKTEKVWQVTSARSRHPQLSGESVPLSETFSNGLMWPGDASGDVSETAGCTCLLSYA